jgi:hypothetical protein
MLSEEARTAMGDSAILSRQVGLVMAVMIIVLPFSNLFTVFIDRNTTTSIGSLESAVRLSPLDPLFVVLIVAAVMWIRRSRQSWSEVGIVTRGVFAFAGLAAVSTMLHMDARSLSSTVRIVGVAAVVYLLPRISEPHLRSFVVVPLLAGASLQTCLALVQVFTDSGATVEATLFADGRSWTAGWGTFGAVYLFAAFLTLAIAVGLDYRRDIRLGRFASATVILASAGIATTFGRSAVLSLAAIAAVYALGAIVTRNPAFASNAAVVIVPFLIFAPVFWSAWAVRINDIASADDRGRAEQVEAALALIEENPLLGVGPARYADAVDPGQQHIVHNIPLLIGAELGVAAAIGFIIWLVVVGVLSIRTSWQAAALFVAPIAFLLTDKFHLTFISGVAMAGLWLGLLQRELRDGGIQPDPEPERVFDAS